MDFLIQPVDGECCVDPCGRSSPCDPCDGTTTTREPTTTIYQPTTLIPTTTSEGSTTTTTTASGSTTPDPSTTPPITTPPMTTPPVTTPEGDGDEYFINPDETIVTNQPYPNWTECFVDYSDAIDHSYYGLARSVVVDGKTWWIPS